MMERRPDPTPKDAFRSLLLPGHIPGEPPGLPPPLLSPSPTGTPSCKSELHFASFVHLLVRNGQGIRGMPDPTSDPPKITLAKMDRMVDHHPHIHDQLVRLHLYFCTVRPPKGTLGNERPSPLLESHNPIGFCHFYSWYDDKCHDCSVSRSYFGAAENILADFVLALLPISIIWNLKISLKKRVNLCILLGLGLL